MNRPHTICRMLLAGVLMVAGTMAMALPAAAQMLSASAEKELDVRFQLEMQRLKTMGPGATEDAKELQKQYDAYHRDAKVREAIVHETEDRIVQAREAFNQYYNQLVTEGDRAGADRMRQLFEISLTGVPVNADAPTEHAGPAPAP